jgi:hypothetical protein
MKLCLKLLAVAVIAVSTYSLTGCSAPSTYSYKNVTISITSFCSDCAAGAFANGGTTYNPAFPQPPNPGSVILMPNTGEGGTTTFVANVTNAPQTNVTWTVYPQGNLSDIDTAPTGTSTPVGVSGNPMGTINATSGNTIFYTVPGPPVYSGAALVQANQLGIPQGDILLVASVPIDPANPSVVATQSQLIQVYSGGSPPTPSTYLTPHSLTSPAGQTQAVVTVPRNTSYAFYGGTIAAGPCLGTVSSPCVNAAGATLLLGTPDDSTVWEVGPTPEATGTAIAGGNATYGTITTQGVYTAPALIPTTSNGTIAGEVVVYAAAHAACAPTCTVVSYAYVGIN